MATNVVHLFPRSQERVTVHEFVGALLFTLREGGIKTLTITDDSSQDALQHYIRTEIENEVRRSNTHWDWLRWVVSSRSLYNFLSEALYFKGPLPSRCHLAMEWPNVNPKQVIITFKDLSDLPLRRQKPTEPRLFKTHPVSREMMKRIYDRVEPHMRPT